MLNLNLFVFKKSDQEWPYDLNTCRCSRPQNLMTQALIVIAFNVHVEGFFTLCDNKDLSKLIKNRHCYSREIDPCRLIFGFLLRRFLVTYFSTIKHRESLNCFTLPNFESCYLFTVSIIQLDFDVLCLTIFERKQENVLVLDEVDTIEACNWTIQAKRSQETKLFFVVEDEDS